MTFSIFTMKMDKVSSKIVVNQFSTILNLENYTNWNKILLGSSIIKVSLTSKVVMQKW